MIVKVGYEKVGEIRGIPLNVNMKVCCHWLIVGGSGSGKSCLVLYVLNAILTHSMPLYIADFKGSGDYIGLSKKTADFGNSVALIDEFYDRFQEIKRNQTGEHILLIIDEYAGMLV